MKVQKNEGTMEANRSDKIKIGLKNRQHEDENGHWEPQKMWNYNFIVLLAVATVSTIGFHFTTPLMSKYSLALGASISLAGVVVGIMSMAAMFSRPVVGVATDTFSKKTVLLVGNFGFGILAFVCAFVSSPLLLIAIRFFQGITFGLLSTAMTAMTAEVVPKSRMGEAVGYQALALVLGMAIGPATGIWLSGFISISQCLMVSAIVMMVCCGLVLTIKNPSKQKAAEVAGVNKNSGGLSGTILKPVLPYAACGAVLMAANNLPTSFLVLVGDERGIANVGIYFVVNAVAGVITKPTGGKLADRYSVKAVLIPTFCITILAMGIFAFAKSTWAIVLCAVLMACGSGMANPMLQSQSIKISGLENSGKAASTYFLGTDIGIALAPIIGGMVAAVFGFQGVFLVAMGMLTLGLLTVLRNKKL